jgi:hypothetical protein
LYTTFAESYVVTRFPKLDVVFVHSGWGGGWRWAGGGGGPIDVRLWRDVLAYNPTVMTIMLGIMTGATRPLTSSCSTPMRPATNTSSRRSRSSFPASASRPVQPSPYDDDSGPLFEGCYNKVLLRFSDFVKQLAVDENLGLADLNGRLIAQVPPNGALNLNQLSQTLHGDAPYCHTQFRLLADIFRHCVGVLRRWLEFRTVLGNHHFVNRHLPHISMRPTGYSKAGILRALQIAMDFSQRTRETQEVEPPRTASMNEKKAHA